MKTQILKVKGGHNATDAVKLSRSILHVLYRDGCVELKSIGNHALSIAMAAYRLANDEILKNKPKIVLVCMQTLDNVTTSEGKVINGLNTRIFPVPKTYLFSQATNQDEAKSNSS